MNCGLGIRPELFNQVLQQKPPLGFLEAHSENYFGESLTRAKLLELREHYPLSLHGVGLSLGRADDLDHDHLTQLKQLVDQVQPMIVSEHLAWSAYAHRHIPDLLPLPLTEQALALMCEHIDQMQQALGRQILVENPSNYLVFDQLQMPEPEFLNTLAARTGCGLLIDINNIYVSAVNIDRDPDDYIAALNSSAIGQYHLAGYTEVQKEYQGKIETLLIDTHNKPVYDPVWDLFETVIAQHGAKPTLFEWDSDFPEFDVLLDECQKADVRLQALGCHDSSSVQTTNKPKAVTHLADTNQTMAQVQTVFLDDVFGLATEYAHAQPGHQHRISVYQNNLFAAMQDYLADIYPATKGVVGDMFFRQMVQLTVQLHPPALGNLHRYGAEIEQVLERFDGLDGLPYLSDLIQYEWAQHIAYYSSLSNLLDPEQTAQEKLLTQEVELNASISLIQSAYPIAEIHRQSLPDYDGEVSINLTQSQDTLLVYKHGHQVHTELLSEVQLALIKQIQAGENLLQAIEVLGGSIDEHDLSASLSFLFTKRLLSVVKYH